MSELVLVANARIPSKRAQSLQVLHAAAGYAASGSRTTVLHAKRRGMPIYTSEECLAFYGVPEESGVTVRTLPNVDWIDAVPKWAQYAPARVQEWTFARRAAKVVKEEFGDATVLSRELETAHRLRNRKGLFMEIHRVPGGSLRRQWLLSAGRSCAGTIAISGGVRKDLLTLGLDRESIFVEHDAYDPDRFSNLPTRAEARTKWGVQGDRPVVVYTGGLMPWKGVDILVQAAKDLPEATFLIAGGMGPDVARIQALAEGLAHVRVLGFQIPENVPSLLRAADVGVIPNRSQPEISALYTSPLKAFEAMALGLPLVVSDLPSLRDVLGEGESEFVAPDDPAALAAGLKSLLQDSGRAQEMGQKLAQRAPRHTFEARSRRILNWMATRDAR